MTINTAFFDAIADQADSCQTCAEVQRLAHAALPQLQVVLDAIAEAEAVLAIGQELLSLNPTDLSSLISFVTKLKTGILTPYLAPYAKLVAQASETTAAVTGAIAAVEAAAARIEGCTISL
jgi:hypothetical protein